METETPTTPAPRLPSDPEDFDPMVPPQPGYCFGCHFRGRTCPMQGRCLSRNRPDGRYVVFVLRTSPRIYGNEEE